MENLNKNRALNAKKHQNYNRSVKKRRVSKNWKAKSASPARNLKSVSTATNETSNVLDEQIHFESPKEKLTCHCGRSFCHFCLKGSYDIAYDKNQDYSNWACPVCTGLCFCSRCNRYEIMLKLMGMYVSLDGDIKELNDFLIKKSNILFLLKDYMVIKSIYFMKNDVNKSPKEIINNMINSSKPKKKNDKVKTINTLNQKQKSFREFQSMVFEKFDDQKVSKILLREEEDKFLVDKCLHFLLLISKLKLQVIKFHIFQSNL